MLSAAPLPRPARVAGDLRRLPLADGSLALATAFFDVVNHAASSGELAAVFAETRRALREGGAFVFDANTPEHLRLWGAVGGDALTLPDGTLLEREAAWSEVRGVVVVTFRIHRTGSAPELLGELVERAFPEGAIGSLLRRSGFRSVRSIPVRSRRSVVLRRLFVATR